MLWAQNENNLIYIFMNVKKKSKIEDKRGKTIVIARFWVSYNIHNYIPETNFHGCQCGQRDHLNAIKVVLNNEHICMMQNYIVSTPTPSVILKTRLYSQKIFKYQHARNYHLVEFTHFKGHYEWFYM